MANIDNKVVRGHSSYQPPMVQNERFPLRHHFDYLDSMAVHLPETRAFANDIEEHRQLLDPSGMAGEGPALPPWVVFDKKILSYDALLMDKIEGDRRLKIFYYLEDDTLQIREQKDDARDIPAGTLFRRHRIPNGASSTRQAFITPYDLTLGAQIRIYGRDIVIVECDEATRKFLLRIGVDVGEPKSQFVQRLRRVKEAACTAPSLKPPKVVNRPATAKNTKRFYEMDGQVLKFSAYWIDPSDESREDESATLRLPGTNAEVSVLNVLRDRRSRIRTLTDPRNVGAVEVKYYTDEDLRIGAVIRVWGREMKIFQCVDEFTRKYYKQNYGIERFDPLEIPLPSAKFRKKDFSQYRTQEEPKTREVARDASDAMRFSATLTDDPERRFVVSVFISDGSVSVYEVPVENAGYRVGRFLARHIPKRPIEERSQEGKSEYYQLEDFFLGQLITLNGFQFRLFDADNWTLRFMESHRQKFPCSSVENILQKLGDQKPDLEKLRSVFTTKSELSGAEENQCHPKDFRTVLIDKFSGEECQGTGILNDQEWRTLERKYGIFLAKPKRYDVERYTAQETLKRCRFNDFYGLMDRLLEEDVHRKGKLPRTDVWRILRVHLNIKHPSLQALIRSLTDEEDEVEYGMLVDLLNYEDFPAPDTTKRIPKEVVTDDEATKKHLEAINVKAFVDDLTTVMSGPLEAFNRLNIIDN